MNYIEKPNLPQKKVTTAFCSCLIAQKIEESLNGLGIEVIKLYTGGDITDEVTAHPDMLCFHIGGSRWLFQEDIYNINKNAIDRLRLDITLCNAHCASAGYPQNIGLNAAYVGKYIFCLEKYTNQHILDINTAYTRGLRVKPAMTDKVNIINIKQGYAKCSICIVDENSIITADMGIYKKAVRLGMDVLLTGAGRILLNGYNYGFIGGAAGLIDKNTIAFAGQAGEDIVKFCGDKGKNAVFLSEGQLYDYGGILPIYEE